jgi:hypothetical protein
MAYQPGAVQAGTLYPSAARTLLQTGDTIVNGVGATALHVYIDWTVEAAAATLTFTVQGRTSSASAWYTLLVSAGLTAVGDVHLRIDPRLTAGANLIAQDAVPAEFRVNVAVGDSSSATYQVDYGLFQ